MALRRFAAAGLIAAWLMITVTATVIPPSVQANDPYIVPGKVLVQFYDGNEPGSIELSRARVTLSRRAAGSRIGRGPAEYAVAPGRENEAAAELRTNPNVKSAEPDYRIFTQLIPNDQQYATQWAHPQINSPAVWDVTTGDSSVVVATLDTGIDRSHPEFTGRLLSGYDYVNNDSDPTDDNGHGSHVAGIMAAAGNNAAGVAGVAWAARILPVKVLDSQGGGSTSDVIRGIDFAIEQNVRIINLSLGSPFPSANLQSAINRALDAGILIVAAAGNCGAGGDGCPSVNSSLYPAAFPGVVAVGATTQGDLKASFSTQSSYVAVSAPGSSILSTYRDGGYRTISGTSMAAPFVSGEAALMLSRNFSLSVSELQDAISSAVVDLGLPGRDDQFGTGRIDLKKGIDLIVAPQITSSTRVVSYNGTVNSLQVQVTSGSSNEVTFVATVVDSWVKINGAGVFTGTTPVSVTISIADGPVTQTRQSSILLSGRGGNVNPQLIEVLSAPLVRQVFLPAVALSSTTAW